MNLPRHIRLAFAFSSAVFGWLPIGVGVVLNTGGVVVVFELGGDEAAVVLMASMWLMFKRFSLSLDLLSRCVIKLWTEGGGNRVRLRVGSWLSGILKPCMGGHMNGESVLSGGVVEEGVEGGVRAGVVGVVVDAVLGVLGGVVARVTARIAAALSAAFASAKHFIHSSCSAHI